MSQRWKMTADNNTMGSESFTITELGQRAGKVTKFLDKFIIHDHPIGTRMFDSPTQVARALDHYYEELDRPKHVIWFDGDQPPRAFRDRVNWHNFELGDLIWVEDEEWTEAVAGVIVSIDRRQIVILSVDRAIANALAWKDA